MTESVPAVFQWTNVSQIPASLKTWVESKGQDPNEAVMKGLETRIQNLTALDKAQVDKLHGSIATIAFTSIASCAGTALFCKSQDTTRRVMIVVGAALAFVAAYCFGLDTCKVPSTELKKLDLDISVITTHLNEMEQALKNVAKSYASAWNVTGDDLTETIRKAVFEGNKTRINPTKQDSSTPENGLELIDTNVQGLSALRVRYTTYKNALTELSKKEDFVKATTVPHLKGTLEKVTNCFKETKPA